jgi:hypothetical protein
VDVLAKLINRAKVSDKGIVLHLVDDGLSILVQDKQKLLSAQINFVGSSMWMIRSFYLS